MKNQKPKVVIWGDSILAGITYDEKRQKYAFLDKSCVDFFKEDYGIQITNNSKFGQASLRALSMIKKSLALNHDYDYALIELGGNDSDFDWQAISNEPNIEHLPKTPLVAFRKNIIEIINEFKKYSIVPLLVSLQPINADKYFNWISSKLNSNNIKQWLKNINVIYRFQERYNSELHQIALDENIHFLNFRDEFLTIHDYDLLLCCDGIHLNSEGHIRLYDIVENILVESFGLIKKESKL